MVITFGNPDGDAGWVTIDTDTGEVTAHPGNGGACPWGYENIKSALLILKHAARLKDPELRKAVIRTTGEYLTGRAGSEILGASGNIVAIF